MGSRTECKHGILILYVVSVEGSNKVHSNSHPLPPKLFTKNKKKEKKKAALLCLNLLWRWSKTKQRMVLEDAKIDFCWSAATFSFMLLTFKGVVLVLVRDLLTLATWEIRLWNCSRWLQIKGTTLQTSAHQVLISLRIVQTQKQKLKTMHT